MKRWNFTTGVAERSPRVEQFLDAVLALSREHGLSIAHEDEHGAFVIEKFSEGRATWLRSAAMRLARKRLRSEDGGGA